MRIRKAMIVASTLAACLTMMPSSLSEEDTLVTRGLPHIVVQRPQQYVPRLEVKEQIPICAVEEKPAEVVSCVNDWEAYYLACCIEAEAGDQGYLGKVYVLDCILNRYDSGNYSTITDVINEAYQFECVSNGYINQVVPAFENFEIIRNETTNRTNSEILHFRANFYHSFGTPMFQYGDHYFSK